MSAQTGHGEAQNRKEMDHMSHAEDNSDSGYSNKSTATCKGIERTKGDARERVPATYNRPVDGYRRPLPRLPFCEEYDGVNLRKTKTISQSIQELMESQRQAREKARDDHQEVVYKSTQYFDRILEDQEIVEQACDLLNLKQADREADDGDSGISSYIDYTDSGHLKVDTFVDTDMDTQEGTGTVDLELEYIAKSSRLIVNVIRAENVKNNKVPNKRMSTFVKVSMYHGKNSKKQKTDLVKKSLNPVFNQKIYLDDVMEKWIHIMCLRVQLYEKKMFRKTCIGETLIWVEDLELAPNKELKLTKSLRPSCRYQK